MVWKHWDRYSVFKQLRNLARPAGCIITHLFWFTFYSLSKLQNNLTSVLNISIHRHRHHHLTISLSGYRARNISIAIIKRLFKALQLTQPEETGYCFNIILILSELLEPTRDKWVPVSSELALYAGFLWLNGLWYLFQRHQIRILFSVNFYIGTT